MKIYLGIYLAILCGTAWAGPEHPRFPDAPRIFDEPDSVPEGLNRLLKAYPDCLASASGNRLRWKDGTEMIFDDGVKNKNFETLLNSPDLEDQMSMTYPAGPSFRPPPQKNEDPGRVRYEPFFMKMYGNSAAAVSGKLVAVRWLPRTVNTSLRITTVNRVNEKLQAVSDELDVLPGGLKKYLNPAAGSFYWRTVRGEKRLSAHSFGIAVDVNVKYGNYWQWDSDLSYKNRIPTEIAEIFERHGFIWGGKWYHYDTVHFEYRPELLIK